MATDTSALPDYAPVPRSALHPAFNGRIATPILGAFALCASHAHAPARRASRLSSRDRPQTKGSWDATGAAPRDDRSIMLKLTRWTVAHRRIVILAWLVLSIGLLG